MSNRDKLSITYATSAGYYPTLQTLRGRKKWAQKPNSINLNNLPRTKFVEVDSYFYRNGFNKAKTRLAGNAVWYRYGNADSAAKLAEDDMKDVSLNSLKNLFAANMVSPEATAIAAAGAVTKKLDNPVVRFIKDSENVYRRNVATYSKSLLSYINKQELSRMGVSGKQVGDIDESSLVNQEAEGRIVEYTSGAMMPSEQLKAAIPYINDEVTIRGQLKDPIGITKEVDNVLRIGNRVLMVEETEKTIAQSGHHGLNSSIMSKKEVRSLLSQGKQGEKELKKRVFQHVQSEIKQNWNPAIKAIKKTAAKTHNRKMADLTPSQVRRPLPKGTMYAKGTLEAQARNRSGRLIQSNAAKAINQHVFGKGRITDVKHSMHYVGNYNDILNRAVMHGLTVAHDPHMTIAAPLRMFPKGHKRAYEFKAIKQKEVELKQGYITLALLEAQGMMGERDKARATNDMQAVHLGARMGGGTSGITVGAITGVNASLGAKAKAGFAYHIPDYGERGIVEDMAMRLLNAAVDGDRGGAHKARQSDVQSMSHRFSNQMIKLQNDAKKAGKIPSDAPYYFWGAPYYGIGIQH